MTRHRIIVSVPAALACAAALLLTASAHAQRGSETNMSGCPDGTKDGVLAAQPTPTPGGGCDNTVYKSDDAPGGVRGIKPSAPKPSQAQPDSTTSTKKKSNKDDK